MNDSTITAEVLHAARILFQPGDLVELRVPKARQQQVISGYFVDLEKLAQEVARLDAQRFPGIYWTLNPIDPQLLARSDHKTKAFAKDLTKDHDIVRRAWLPVDLDPKRPTGISANEEQHAAALRLAEQISSALIAEGWPEPLVADSGNGAHLLWRIDLPNSQESDTLLSRALLALFGRFNTPDDQPAPIEVDRTTFNASRIFKIYGTMARKGDNTADRPHRRSRILHVPALLTPVSPELLRLLASSAPGDVPAKHATPAARPYRGTPAREFDLREFLVRHGLRFRDPVPHEGGLKYVLEECPFDPTHKAPDSAVFERSDGYGFKCFHNSCSQRGWKEFRGLFDGPRRPYVPRSSAGPPPAPDPPGLSDVKPACDAPAELPLSAGDVEAAIDAAIESADLPAAMRLIPAVAITPAYTQALIIAKLRLKFKRDFPARDFARALKAIEEEAAKKNIPALDEDDMPPEDAPDLIGDIPLTDSGNGERILKLAGDDIRFCAEFKKWLLWDGRRWKVDTDAATVTQKAKNMARLLYKQAALIPDSGRRKVLQDHARDSESQAAIAAALLRCKSEPGMSISAADLDKHRYLLNCINGVVDVRTGELLPFDRKYYITKLCHVKYNPDSVPEKDCPRFLKFLYWAMGETPDMGELPESITRMVNFLQKAFGYALTGDVSEKAAFIFYGARGNNGKTTLLTIFKTILAEYAAQLDINTLMTSKFTDNNVRADLAKLHGARFVITSEVDEGQRLSERLMKYLTAGMGEITACRKFENPFEFPATHKIWMDCNYRPEIKGADEAIWGRLKCVAFHQRIDKNDPEIDKQLIEKILAEAEGVLAWTVRGAMRWAKDGGLGEPPEIEAAGAEWRDADDPLRPFLEECCEVNTDPDHLYFCRCADFTRAYQEWCRQNNEPQLKSSRLTQRLLLKGIKLNRSRRISAAGKQARCWDGVRILEDVTQVSGPRSGRVTEDQV